jgi:hypothetical protein
MISTAPPGFLVRHARSTGATVTPCTDGPYSWLCEHATSATLPRESYEAADHVYRVHVALVMFGGPPRYRLRCHQRHLAPLVVAVRALRSSGGVEWDYCAGAYQVRFVKSAQADCHVLHEARAATEPPLYRGPYVDEWVRGLDETTKHWAPAQ